MLLDRTLSCSAAQGTMVQHLFQRLSVPSWADSHAASQQRWVNILHSHSDTEKKMDILQMKFSNEFLKKKKLYFDAHCVAMPQYAELSQFLDCEPKQLLASVIRCFATSETSLWYTGLVVVLSHK